MPRESLSFRSQPKEHRPFVVGGRKGISVYNKMDSNLSTIKQVEIEAPTPLVSLPGRKSSYREVSTSASAIYIFETDPNPK